MKNKYILILALLIITFFSCSTEEVPNTIYASEISFVHADGTAISVNECNNSNLKYAVKIQTTSKSNANGIPLKVDYSVNGVLYTMNFTMSGAQINPIELAEGNNSAYIIGTDYKSSFNYITQGDFELVE